MILIYKGYGFLVGLLPLLVGFCLQKSVNSITQNNRYYNDFIFGNFTSLIISGVLLFVLNKKLLAIESGYSMIDPETSQRVYTQRREHSFFFITIKFWGYIFVIFGSLGVIFELYQR